MKLLPLAARLAAYGVLAWGLVVFVLVVFVAMAWTVPTVLDWFVLLGTVGAGVALVRRKDPRWAAGIGGVMATIGIYLGLTGRSGGDIPLGEQLRPLLDAAHDTYKVVSVKGSKTSIHSPASCTSFTSSA
jgi:hypothetical protein